MQKSGPLNGPPSVLSFNPIVVVFGGLKSFIVLMFIALAWHERENAGALLCDPNSNNALFYALIVVNLR